MNEISVIVKQEPGRVIWNFEGLKKALENEMSAYEGMVYDDENIKAAKADVASLRKLKKAVEDKRKEIKNVCLEPYTAIEAQSKELTGLIDRPINLIAKQVSEYEAQQKAARKARIMDYMANEFKDFPPEIQKKAQFACYDSKWENATAKEKDWKFIVVNFRDTVSTALGVIANTDPDFRDAAMRVYTQNLSLPDAMAKVQELQRQKEMLIERQKQREEEERRRKEEEQRRREAEAEKPTPDMPEPKTLEAIQEAGITIGEEIIAPEKIAPGTNYTWKSSKLEHPEPGTETMRLAITGTPHQIRKICDYIKFTGATYREVRQCS